MAVGVGQVDVDDVGAAQVLGDAVDVGIWAQPVAVASRQLGSGSSSQCTRAGRPTTGRALAPSGRRAYLVTSPCTLAGSPAELLEWVVPEYGLTAATFRSPDDSRTGELVTAVLDRRGVDSSTPRVEVEERTCDELPGLCPGHPRKPTPLPAS